MILPPLPVSKTFCEVILYDACSIMFYRPEVRFITWTTSDLDPSMSSSLCSLPPHVAIEVSMSYTPMYHVSQYNVKICILVVGCEL